MNGVNLIAQVCMYNEVLKGNLDRCLDNLRRYCDHIIVYDDASTDGSVAVAEAHGCQVIRGQANNQCEELAHKQALLEAALEMGGTHLFWLDCDEVLDRPGTIGGLRELCENWPDGLDAYSFPEINLWRSQTWQRLDSLFSVARFVRLWRVQPGIHFNVRWGVHKRLYPATIEAIQEAPYGVIHYGFWDYKRMLVKIGAHHLDTPGLQSCAEFGLDGRGANWILDERGCSCRRVPDDRFPPGCLPPDIWKQPGPRRIDELVAHGELPDEPSPPLVDRRAKESWASLHGEDYHWEIHKRNGSAWASGPGADDAATLFGFDPYGKVVVDLGCGGGWHVLSCLRQGASRAIGVEADPGLVSTARGSFEAIGAPPDRYGLEYLDCPDLDLPPADIIYSLAVFMHLPFWQACGLFRWVAGRLASGGEAHLQFYQGGDGRTMFWDGLSGTPAGGDHVSNVRLHHELERAGLRIVSTHLAEGPGILPVWQMYRCERKRHGLHGP